jgi:hypothetical protein
MHPDHALTALLHVGINESGELMQALRVADVEGKEVGGR